MSDDECLEGILIAISHLFRINEKTKFFIELKNLDGIYHIIVDHDKHLVWHLKLKIGYLYKFSHLEYSVIDKDNEEIEIAYLTQLSVLTKIEQNVVGNVQPCHNLFSVQGDIVRIVDSEMGIFLLSNGMQLATAYLEGFTELGSIGGVHEIPGLRVGCRVSVHNAHVVYKEGIEYLVCCGKSLIVTQHPYMSPPLMNAFICDSVLHCVNLYQLNFDGFLWMREMRNRLLKNLNSMLDKKQIIRSFTRNNSKSNFTRFVENIFKDHKKGLRSLVWEFLSQKHQCVVANAQNVYKTVDLYLRLGIHVEIRHGVLCDVLHEKNFQLIRLRDEIQFYFRKWIKSFFPCENELCLQITTKMNNVYKFQCEIWIVIFCQVFKMPFSLHSVKEIQTMDLQLITGRGNENNGEKIKLIKQQREEIGQSQMPPLWQYKCQKSDQWLLCGLLRPGANGYLHLVDDTGQMDVIVLNDAKSQMCLLQFVDELVAIREFIFVEEKFLILEEGNNYRPVLKTYLAVNLRDLHQLQVLHKPVIAMKRMLSDRLVTFKLISKSCLWFGDQNWVQDKYVYFICYSLLSCQQAENGRFLNLIIGGDNALRYHPLLLEGNHYHVEEPQFSGKDWLQNTFKLGCLRSLRGRISTAEAVRLPGGAKITKWERFARESDQPVSEVSNAAIGELVTVVGVILERKHLGLSKFIEFRKPLGKWEHVGMPGQKVVCLVLQDATHTKSEVRLYLSDAAATSALYPFGIIPGVSVKVSNAMVAQSSSKQKYLKWIHLTQLVPLTQPRVDHCMVKPIGASNHLADVLTSSQHGISLLFVCVTQLFKLTIKCQCPGCGSDMIQGVCMYVGCHNGGPVGGGDLKASAIVGVEDSTATSIVYLNGCDQVRTLCGLSAMQWLCVEKWFKFPNVDKKKGNQDQQWKITLNFVNKILRHGHFQKRLALTCRHFSANSNAAEFKSNFSPQLYCIHLSEIKPTEHSEALLTQ